MPPWDYRSYSFLSHYSTLDDNQLTGTIPKDMAIRLIDLCVANWEGGGLTHDLIFVVPLAHKRDVDPLYISHP